MARILCVDCIYWDEMPQSVTTKSREGRCRRHAPTPSSEEAEKDMGTIWPATFDDDWCGEAVHINQLAEEIAISDLVSDIAEKDDASD
ncbi:MAG: hypothetical protein ACON4G_00315 [Candidatus Puniceispirillaceae bacterium]